MFGTALQEERHRLRTYLRHIHWGVPRDVVGFLDDAELLVYTDSMGGGLPAIYRRQLMAGALAQIGIPEDKLRAIGLLHGDEHASLKRSEWIADPVYAQAIEDEVLRQLPETPEPERGPASTAGLNPDLVGPMDPNWSSAGMSAVHTPASSPTSS